MFRRLHQERIEKQNWAKLEQEKALLELRDCTFSPTINKKSMFKSRSSERSTSAEKQDPYTRLY